MNSEILKSICPSACRVRPQAMSTQNRSRGFLDPDATQPDDLAKFSPFNGGENQSIMAIFSQPFPWSEGWSGGKVMHKGAIHILLVENSETDAAMIRDALEPGPAQRKVTVVQSLAAAQTFLSESFPDLAIIDLHLPDGKGIELLPADREKAAFPAVIVANREETRAAVEALQAGALDYVVKSAATLTEMPRIVENALNEWARIADHRRAKTALRENEERFRSFFESAASGMAIISPEGRALKVNPTFCRLSGYSEAEALEKNVLEVTHPDDRIKTRRFYEEIRSGRRRVVDYEKRYLRKDGSIVWGRATVAGVFGPDGSLNYFAANVQDITARKQAEQALVEANRALDAFVYTVSHDLRTPLTPIISYAELLQHTCRDRLDRQALGCLAEIEGQGRRMLALMEDLLTLAKVGHVPRPAVPVDPDAVLSKILTDLGSQIAGTGIDVKRNPLPELRIPQTLLTQIFHNLIDNAIRYAGREGSPVEVGGERRGDLVLFYVRDHGPGIPPAEHRQIFEVFYRGAPDKKSPGTGVGLATVQKISRLYGGRAWVEGTAGGGSTFWVELLDSREP